MNPEAFQSALSRLMDGELPPEEFAELEQHLADSAEARRYYLDYVDLHNVLDLEHPVPGRIKSVGTPAVPVDLILERQKRRAMRRSALAAAALLALMAVVFKLVLVPEPEPLLSFRTTPESVLEVTHFAVEGEAPVPGTLAEGSRLQLRQGAVELALSSGVTAIVQAPADLTLHAQDKLFLGTGTGWFHVPPGARGFQVMTREMRVIDLGTEFGIVSTPKADDEVHVFGGKVAVHAVRGVKSSTTLTAGSARRVRPSGRFMEQTPDEARFAKQLPATLPHLHWSFDDNHMVEANTLAGSADPSSVFQNAGTQPAGERLAAGRFGQALHLDDPGEQIRTDWPGILGDAPRSIAFWVKIPERREDISAVLVGWGTQQGGDDSKINSKCTIHLDYSTRRRPTLNFSFGGFWYFFPDTVLDDGRWHHLAAVYHGKSDDQGFPVAEVYVNGQRARKAPRFHTPLDLDLQDRVIIDTLPETPLVIGAAYPWTSPSPTETFGGQIDELYVIAGAIGERSVLQLMHSNNLTQQTNHENK